MREWYEVRVREHLAPTHWVKKSKFYFVHGPGEAVAKYHKKSKVEHTIMWCEKDRRHRPEFYADQMRKLEQDIRREQRVAVPASGVGLTGTLSSFLGLGNELLAELKGQEKAKVIKRRKNDIRYKQETSTY